MFICVLSGAFLFAADLIKRVSIDCEVSFIRVSSYSGTQSTGVVKSVVGIATELKNRHVVILEDIVDTGDTAVYLMDEIKTFSGRCSLCQFIAQAKSVASSSKGRLSWL